LSSGFLSGLIAQLRGSKAVYNVQEIYPDLLIKYAKIKNRSIISFLKFIEKKTYEWSSKVTTIDYHFKKIIENRLPINKIDVIPNFVDTEFYRFISNEDTCLKKFGNKFLVGYVGNIGKLQDWDLVVNSIDYLKNLSEIHFVLIGGGDCFDSMSEIANSRSNLTVIPYINRSQIPLIISRINLHFICMNHSSDKTGLPSKIYSILSCERPILAASSINTPLYNALKESGNALVVDLQDYISFSNYVIDFYKNSISNISNTNGRDFVIKNFSKDAIMNKYFSLFKSLNDCR
jgi:glycosyltransferase involved in cell wall biosynthesis